MKKVLKGWLTDNPVTTGNKREKILQPHLTGSLTLTDIINRMDQEDTGLRRETLEHVVNLFQRKVAEAVSDGYSVSTGLFRAAPQFRGVIRHGKWDPEVNTTYASFTQEKHMREALSASSVDILGEKGDVAYVLSSEDISTHATDGTATAGRNYCLRGRYLKVAGDEATTGITLTDSKGVTQKLSDEMIVTNNPTELIILLPAELADDTYLLTITTQYSGTIRLLKSPRTINHQVVVYQPADGKGDDPSA